MKKCLKRVFFWLFVIFAFMPLQVAIAQPFAYISNNDDDTISVVDTATNTVSATIAVGDDPEGVAVDPAGTRVYVTNEVDNTVSVIDTATNTVAATIPVGDTPKGVAINLAGTYVYVTNEEDNTVSVIDTTTNTVVATVAVGSSPEGIAVDPAGTRVYVANHDDDTISVVDTATNTVTATIPAVDDPEGVAVNPAGTRAYATSDSNNTVFVIDTATNTVIATIAVGNEPKALAINPAGTRVYVTNGLGNTVSVIDAGTNTVIATVAVGSSPEGVAVSPAGTRVYVANHDDDTVSVLDTETNTVITTVAVGNGPVALGDFIGPETGYGMQLLGIGSMLSGTPSPDDSITFIAQAIGPGPLYFKFLYKAGYGTAAYSTNPWVQVQDFGTSNMATFVFPSADNYLVVVQGIDDLNSGFTFGDPQGGMTVRAESISNTQLIALSANVSRTPQPGDSVIFTAQAIGPGPLYFKFLYKAGYGTAAYSTNPWVQVQDFGTSNMATFVFPSADNYLVVVQGIDDLNSGFTFGDPQGGMTINVQQAIQITSTAFQQGATIPVKYTCDRDNVSPPLAWSGIPEGTQSIALICDDPDAPGMIWVHWVLFNLPPDTVALSENVPDQATLTNGARHGINDSGNLRYNGPCPPPGIHRYYFKIYALDTMLNLQAGATKTQVLNAMAGHILAEGALMGRYGR